MQFRDHGRDGWKWELIVTVDGETLRQPFEVV
jgi:hypothetical protein